MNRHFIALGLALAAVTVRMPPAGASRNLDWSDWSTPVNLGALINSAFSDASPAISRDGLTLYFSSNRQDGLNSDIYVARRESLDLPWEEPVKLGETINTGVFEGFPALSRNEHHLFFARSPGEIWVSYREHVHEDLGDSGWEAPSLLGPGVNTAVAEQGPSYFENRKRGLPQLYFHRADGDIYVADAFGSAVPVLTVNSPGFEARPSISGDGLEIFFHSNRHRPDGLPEFDMYSSVRKSVLEPWSTPQNLGSGVNTGSNDFLGAISPDGETLYFTSNRPVDNLGGVDIYMTTRGKQRRHEPGITAAAPQCRRRVVGLCGRTPPTRTRSRCRDAPLGARSARRLGAITNERVLSVKLAMAQRVPKTVNNGLTVSSTLLRKAIHWGEFDKLPCTITTLEAVALDVISSRAHQKMSALTEREPADG